MVAILGEHWHVEHLPFPMGYEIIGRCKVMGIYSAILRDMLYNETPVLLDSFGALKVVVPLWVDCMQRNHRSLVVALQPVQRFSLVGEKRMTLGFNVAVLVYGKQCAVVESCFHGV